MRALLFVLLFFAPAMTQAGPILPGSPDRLPLLYVCVNAGGGDVCRDLSDAIQVVPVDGKDLYVVEGLEVLFQVAQIVISAVYDPDPSIMFSVTPTNLLPGPVTYSALFGTPIVAGNYNIATSTGDLNLTNGTGTATVENSAIYPAYISGNGTNNLVPTNLGVDLGTTPCVAGPAVPTTTNCPQGTDTNIFAQTFYNNLEALITYTQTDAFSTAAWTGEVTLELDRSIPDPNVPEPALLGLFGLAVIGFGMRRLRR